MGSQHRRDRGVCKGAARGAGRAPAGQVVLARPSRSFVTEPTLADWQEMYGALWRIRHFEGHVQRLAAAGEIPGFPHLSTGQEAVAVGVCTQLRREDML